MFLRPIEDSDLPHLKVWRNTEEIIKWTRQRDFISKEHHLKWYTSLASRSDIKMYSIVLDSGTLVGVCGLTSIDRVNSRAEFSLYIGPENQQSGLGGKALALLLDKAFMIENLNLIWGESFEGNPAIKLFKKIGMVEEGTRRQFYFREGQYIDCHLFSITKEEWRNKRATP
jgi:RimJ/RimL family protein N-acetyltransferase